MHFLRLFLFLLFLFNESCLKTNALSNEAKKNQNRFLHLAFDNDVRSLDPRIGVDAPSGPTIKMLFEGLMHIGINGNIQPGIAESYEISRDKKTYIFHLRSSKWTNGDAVTAYDFEYAWKKNIHPQTLGLGAQNFYPIKNVKAVVQGLLPIEAVGIQALNETTLKVELEHPTPYFLEVTTTVPFLPINSRIDQTQANWLNQTGKAFVCNGPFYLERYLIENQITLKKNPFYWDEKNVFLPGIIIDIIHDCSTILSFFEKNKIDWIGRPFAGVSADAIPSLIKQGKLHYQPILGVSWYFLNTKAFPFTNKKMRQAFAYAMNRKNISDHILHSLECPALSLLPGKLAPRENPYFEDNNVDEALKLFNEALEEMHISKKDLLPITISYSNQGIHARIAEAFQEQWSRIFGLNIKMEKRDWKVHYAELQAGNFQIGAMAWFSWIRDPIYIMQTFLNKNDGLNMSRWENETYISLLKKTEEETDVEVRRELFHQAQKILMEEFPVIPITFISSAYLINDKLKNVCISELFDLDFRSAFFEE